MNDTFREVIYKNSDGSIFPVNESGMLDSLPCIRHFFSMRHGGVSRGIYEDLNFSFTNGDDPEAVRENFRRAAFILGRSEGDIVCTSQTHTVNIRTVAEDDRGCGVTKEKGYDDVDGLVTNLENTVLTVFTADCVPLLFADPVKKVIATAHSGWKGTVGRIGDAMVRRMERDFGCDPKDIRCAAGPCVCKNCYEVSADVADRFRAEFTGHEDEILAGHGPGKYLLDLKKTNEIILMEAGLDPRHIDISGRCTCCEPDKMFSHRVHGINRGNMGAFITLV